MTTINTFYNNYYSRQIGTYGIGTQTKIMEMNICLYGLRGVGIETAKNLILAGPKSLTIFDPNTVKINDLTSNYFLQEEDVKNNKRRDEACLSSLSELNPNVNVNIMQENDIIKDIQKKLKIPELKYDVIVITEFLPKKLLIEINELCRKEKIGFILVLEFGIYGLIFVDFGNNFTIIDETGDEIKEYLIKNITKEKNGKVTINTELTGNIKLTSKDLISFKEIQGMTELNNCTPIKIKINHDNRNIIEIVDTSNFSDYISGGVLFNVKQPKTINFESFEKRLEEPIKEREEYRGQIDSNPNIKEILGIGLLSLFDFFDKNGKLPEINESKDAEEILEIAQNILKQKEKEELFWVRNIRSNMEIYDVDFDFIFKQTIKRLSNWAKTEICPIASFIAGITAQEVIKYTGKYKPIHQWLYCNFSQLVENIPDKDINDRKMINSRYDDQIAIFGQEMQEKLSNINIFMIGAGALGCEFLKTFSAMGIGTKENKKVFVADNDNIELSNLNRQFLFNKNSIGKSKAEVACESIRKMNKDFNCDFFQARVSQESENIFCEDFWEKQDFIINAVDNIEARKYIAEQSLIYKKTLIDSGTLGTKANSQVIIPHKTIPYIIPQKKEEDNKPVCTLADHPFNINHCIIWAKDNYEKYFVNDLKEIKKDIKKFLKDRNLFLKELKKNTEHEKQMEKIKEIFEFSKIVIEKNFEKCVEKALKQYNINFNYKILDLLEINKTKNNFWTSDKRLPHPIPFNIENKYSFIFVKQYAQILARSLSIPIIEDDKRIIEIIKKIKIDDYIPTPVNTEEKSNIDYNCLTKEEKEELDKVLKNKIKSSLVKVNNYIKEINSYFDSLKNKENNENYADLIKIEEFDKDNDSKGHVQFLYAFTNLRADNYNIDKCDISKVKMVAGKIIPAIASTTAAIVGIVAMQLYVLKSTDNIRDLRNCYLNLANNIYSFENVRKAKNIDEENINENSKEKYKFIPKIFSNWDYLVIKGSLTINKFIDYIKQEYNVEIKKIISNTKILFNKEKKQDDILDQKIEDVYNNISSIKLFENKKFLMLEITGDIDDYIAKMPSIKYYFK